MFNVIIDRAVGVFGHGKDVVGGLNAVDKKMFKINVLDFSYRRRTYRKPY